MPTQGNVLEIKTLNGVTITDQIPPAETNIVTYRLMKRETSFKLHKYVVVVRSNKSKMCHSGDHRTQMVAIPNGNS